MYSRTDADAAPAKADYINLDEETETSTVPAGWRRKGWCLAAGAMAGVMLGGVYGELRLSDPLPGARGSLTPPLYSFVSSRR